MKAVLNCTCPACGRPKTAMRGDWTTYPHNNPQTGEKCAGGDPERLFTAILRRNRLDARSDAPAQYRPDFAL